MSSSRRDFLKTAGASVAAASLAPMAASGQTPAAQPADRPFGYAIVGIGALAQSDILPAFAAAKRSRVTALVSGDPAKAKDVAAKYQVPESGLYSYDTFDRIADNPDVDAVYIVLPNNLHAQYTIRAHKAGKHVLVEKPMANTARDCEAMIAAARDAKKWLMVAYRLRYEPYTQEMIRLVREREFGRPRVILAEAGFNIGNPEQWRLSKATGGGGSMMDIGIYAVNAARYLSGEEPTEIAALESTDRSDPRFKEVEDTITFQMRFPSGVLANCVSSYGTLLNRFRVHAEKGSFEMEPAWSRSNLAMRVFRGGRPQARDLPQVNHFAAMMDHLAESAANGTAPLTDGTDGLNDLRAIEAVYQSVANGSPVKLSQA